MQYVNESEKFWKHSYRVHLHEFDTDGILINADNEQDALDYAVDYAEEQGWHGLFLEPQEVEEYGDEVIFAGNHCRPLINTYIQIKQLD